MEPRRLQPILDNVIVEPEEMSTVLKTEGHTTVAKVIAVGRGGIDIMGKRIPMDVKAGDRILFDPRSIFQVNYKDKEIHYIKDRDIIAIL